MRGHAHANYRPERSLAPLDPRSQLAADEAHERMQLAEKLKMPRPRCCDLVLKSAALGSARCAVQCGIALQAVALDKGSKLGLRTRRELDIVGSGLRVD